MSEDSPNITYFTYGSNIWKEQMKKLYPDSIYIGIGLLSRWRFIIDTLGWTNIVPSPEDHVYGFIYELTPEDKQAMDKNEGDDYKALLFPVEVIKNEETDTKTIKPALVYLDPTHTTPGPPSESTVKAMRKAIEDGLEGGIPLSYFEKYIIPLIDGE